MTEPIRIGIVGAGRIVAVRARPAVPRDRRRRARRRRQPLRGVVAPRGRDELGHRACVPVWQALVADPEIDAVLVGAWPYLHAPVTIAALDAGKHVLTEARMAATGARTPATMLRAARAHPDRVAMVVPAIVLAWADATIVRLLRDGAIGRVRHVQVGWDVERAGRPGRLLALAARDQRRERHGPRHPGRGDGPLARPAGGGHRGDTARTRRATRTRRSDRRRRAGPRPRPRRVSRTT